MFHQVLRIALGVTFWLAAAWWLVELTTAERENHSSAFDDITAYFKSETLEFDLRFSRLVKLGVGDASAATA